MSKKTGLKSQFSVACALYPKAEDEDYRGGGGEGALDQSCDTLWYLEKIIKENQADTLIFWTSLSRGQKKLLRQWRDGKLLQQWCGIFRENKLKLLTMYSQGHHNQIYLNRGTIEAIGDILGDDFLGENIGEWANRWFYAREGYANHPGRVFRDLLEAKDALLNEHYRPKIEQLKNMGYKAVYTTSAHAIADYEFESGTAFCFHESCECAYALSEMRGAWKKWRSKGFGLYMNHDWYTKNIPYSAPQKYDLLRSVLYQSWIGGCFMTGLESGNLWTEGGFHTLESTKNYPYEHEHCANYRKEMRDFKTFTDSHQRSAQIPDVKICFARGNLDGFNGTRRWVDCSERFDNQRECVFGLRGNAVNDRNYLYGEPEFGWDIYFKVAAPVNPAALSPYRNHRLCGTPFGQTDIVGIDEKVSDELLKGYSLIVYCGWNTMTPEIYRKLISYVKQGGTLLMALPQCSMRTDREYWNYQVKDIVNDGNLSGLFGVKIKGKKQFIMSGIKGEKPLPEFYSFYDYDVVQQSQKSPQTISDFQTGALLAEVEMDEAAEALVCQRSGVEYAPQRGEPLVVRKKLGKGQAILTLAWDYPGARGLKDLYTYLVKNLLHANRDKDCYITERNSDIAGDNCKNIFYAKYPQEIYLLNSDCVSSREFMLHPDGRKLIVNLAPGEFKIIKRNKQ